MHLDPTFISDIVVFRAGSHAVWINSIPR